jgi:hypothetical protein
MTKKGLIEYSIKGEAPYILFIHGTPGGHDIGDEIPAIY